MNDPFPAYDPARTRDTVWTRDAAANSEPGAVNVTGIVFIDRHPADHPLRDLLCGILIIRLAGYGYGRHLWYN